MPDLILHGGCITSLDPAQPEVSAIAIRDGRVVSAGSDRDVMAQRSAASRVIDLQGHRAIPGLNDSHIHPIRGGLNFNMELRWDGVPSLADALRLLREQARRTPAPQWVRVVGGWSEFQFAERRMPTLARGPKLGLDDQLNSTRHFLRELNRLGVTSVIERRRRVSELSRRLPGDRDVQCLAYSSRGVFACRRAQIWI